MYLFILFGGISKSILFNSILNFAILSDFKIGNLCNLLALIYYTLSIIQLQAKCSIKQKIAHFTALQRIFFDMYMLYSYFVIDFKHKTEVTRS